MASPLLPALERYFDAYRAGDVDELAGCFGPDAEVAFGQTTSFRGDEGIRSAHRRIGTFEFVPQHVYDTSGGQIVEGTMLALRHGEPVVDAPVPFAVVALREGEALTALRFYYDGGLVRQAVEAAGLAP